MSWEDENHRWDHLRPLFHLGEMVLVHMGLVLEGRSPYPGPLKVVRVLGRYTFKLGDVQKWSAWRMKRWVDLTAEASLEPSAAMQQPVGAAGRELPRMMMQAIADKPLDQFKC